MSINKNVVLDILDNINRRDWSARKNKQNDKFIFEVLDGNQKRIGVFTKANNALIASAAPEVLDRFLYMLDALSGLKASFFSPERNKLIKESGNEELRRMWFMMFKEFTAFEGQSELALQLATDSILESRSARYDPYEN